VHYCNLSLLKHQQIFLADFIRIALNLCVVKRREETQLDATECFIALITCSTCFGHLYAHHQEFEAMLVLLPHMVCNALVTGGRLLGAEQQAIRPGEGMKKKKKSVYKN